MTSIIRMTLSELTDKFLPLCSREDWDRVQIIGTSNIMESDMSLDNVQITSVLYPAGYSISKLVSDEVKKSYEKEYISGISTSDNMAVILTILADALKYDKILIFVCTDEEAEKLFYLPLFFKMLKKKFGIEGCTLDEYFRSPEKYNIPLSKIHEVRSAMSIEHSAKYSADVFMDIKGKRRPVNFTESALLTNANLDFLYEICLYLGVDRSYIHKPAPGKTISMEEKYQTIMAICEISNELTLKELETEDLKELTYEEIVWYGHRLSIKEIDNVPTKKDALNVLKSRMKSMTDKSAIYSRANLEKMKDYELLKLAWECGITGINPYDGLQEREKLIIKIMEVKGVVIENFKLPKKKEMMNMKKKELYSIFLNNYNGNADLLTFENVKATTKETFVDFIIGLDKAKKKSDKITNLKFNDLMDMKKKDILKLAKGIYKTKDGINDYYYYLEGIEDKKELVYSMCEHLRIRTDVDELRENPPKKEELKEMNKQELLELGWKLGLDVTGFGCSRSEILEEIVEYTKEVKKYKKQLAKKSEVNKKNLEKESRVDLVRFCRSNAISFEPSWGKKKIIKAILKEHERLKERKKQKDNETKNED